MTTEVDRRTREALDEGLDQLRHGWTPAEVVCVLMDAYLSIEDLRVWCDSCDEEITGVPVRDPVEALWLPRGGSRFCCRWCLAVYDERRISAAGNGAS